MTLLLAMSRPRPRNSGGVSHALPLVHALVKTPLNTFICKIIGFIIKNALYLTIKLNKLLFFKFKFRIKCLKNIKKPYPVLSPFRA